MPKLIKYILLTIFIICLFVGCIEDKSNDDYSALEFKETAEWDIYSFKELGFSIQLPYLEKNISYSYIDFSEDKSSQTGKRYSAVLKNIDTQQGNLSFLNAITADSSAPRGGLISDFYNLIKKDDKYFGIWLPQAYEIHPLKFINKGLTQIVIFDPNVDYYKDSLFASEEFMSIKRYAAAFNLPNSEIFDAALLIFTEETLSYEDFIQVLESIEFSN